MKEKIKAFLKSLIDDGNLSDRSFSIIGVMIPVLIFLILYKSVYIPVWLRMTSLYLLGFLGTLASFSYTASAVGVRPFGKSNKQKEIDKLLKEVNEKNESLESQKKVQQKIDEILNQHKNQ
jgi:hypothetical protein